MKRIRFLLIVIVLLVIMVNPVFAQDGQLEVELSVEKLTMIAGTVLTLAFSYIPGLSPKFDALQPEVKRSIMLVLVVITGTVVYVLALYGLVAGVEIGQPGLVTLVHTIILTAIANQSIYSLSPSTPKVSG